MFKVWITNALASFSLQNCYSMLSGCSKLFCLINSQWFAFSNKALNESVSKCWANVFIIWFACLDVELRRETFKWCCHVCSKLNLVFVDTMSINKLNGVFKQRDENWIFFFSCRKSANGETAEALFIDRFWPESECFYF